MYKAENISRTKNIGGARVNAHALINGNHCFRPGDFLEKIKADITAVVSLAG